MRKNRSASCNPEKVALQRELEFARAYADGRISLDEAAFPWSRVWTVQVSRRRRRLPHCVDVGPAA